MTALVDDHLLRDLLATRPPDELGEIAKGQYATTNLYYYRLCKSAAAAPRAGRLLGHWSEEQRRALMERLVVLPADIVVVPMRDLTPRMAAIASDHAGLSTLGAEAIAATERLSATLCVAAEDDGPGIRHAITDLGLEYRAISW